MNTKTGTYQVVDLTAGRRVMINMLDLSGPRQFMYGLLEVDVTTAQQVIVVGTLRKPGTKNVKRLLILSGHHFNIQQMVAFCHQKWDTPEILTIEPLLNVLKLTFEWVSNGGE
jgi:hypothetical protein